jgi:DNA-binding SARP family transcriptional activator
MSTLRIRLFGKFSVLRDAQLLKGLGANKEQELLSYLLVRRDRFHPRETLATVLWGDTSTERSKKYLRQALWHVQSALEAGDSLGLPLLVVEHDWVQLNLQSEVWLDVAEFERAFATTQDLPGNQLDTISAALLKGAIELYKGDLLDGWYHDWCLFERERLQNMYLCMLDKLMSYCEKHSEYEAGQRYGSTILRYDRAHERTHRQLMHLQYMAGDRTGALRAYERCVAALDEELNVKPDRRTTALYEYIRNDGPTESETVGMRPTTLQGVSLPEVLGRLKRLQSVLAAVQRRLQRDVAAVEHTLDTPKR